MATWELLDGLDRPDVRIVDATRSEEMVYRDVREHLAARGVIGT